MYLETRILSDYFPWADNLSRNAIYVKNVPDILPCKKSGPYIFPERRILNSMDKVGIGSEEPG